MGESPWKFESSRPHHLVRGPLPDTQKTAGSEAEKPSFRRVFWLLALGERGRGDHRYNAYGALLIYPSPAVVCRHAETHAFKDIILALRLGVRQGLYNLRRGYTRPLH